jgi:UDP-N-acetylglucosamine 2-epimerase
MIVYTLLQLWEIGPEIIKMSMLVNSLNGRYRNECGFTGQHYSTNMKDIFSNELDIKFDYD